MDRNYQRQTGPGIGSLILNLLTLGVLLMTLCAGGAMTVVFINPATIERISPLLPIKLVVPPTLMPTLGFPTRTNTPEIYLPSTGTPTPSRTPGGVATVPPTETPTPTEVPPEEARSPHPRVFVRRQPGSGARRTRLADAATAGDGDRSSI
jgi:hypothetical protein